MKYTASDDIETWIRQLQALNLGRRCPGPRFVKPYHLVTLAHTLRRLNIQKLQLPEKVESYADTMQLWAALGIASPFGQKLRRATGRYHPIQLLKEECLIEEATQALTQLFRTVCASPETLDAIDTMLRELIGNCFAHSAVTDGLYGILCAQVWRGGRKAQIALADSGIGIRASLRQNTMLFARLSSGNSCELATEYGVTGKPGEGHSGYGLAIARKLLEQNQGVLYLRSGHEMFCLSSGRVEKKHTQAPWNGTLLMIEWDLDGAMDIGKVYSGFPLPEGMNDDDFNF